MIPPSRIGIEIYVFCRRYSDAIAVLNYIYDSNPTSRAALSLLAYCYYNVQDYVNAANCYEQLTIYYPDEEEYRINYAQALYAATLYDEAMKITVQVVEFVRVL